MPLESTLSTSGHSGFHSAFYSNKFHVLQQVWFGVFWGGVYLGFGSLFAFFY